ncbi:hypothetical protein [Mycolicibacterium sp.]|uniref:hypothetical protein n=1 Tax=Mycolicibacterium sp. TaxID=2320850 RepID=UPI0025E6337C|nr:hypothetical protein [Mycolicibacterium sp.]
MSEKQPEKQPTNLATKSPESAKEANAQAREYDSPFAPTDLVLDDGTVIEIPPHPNLRILDDDVLDEYEALLFEAESYDRGPDFYIPEQQAKDSAGNPITLPAETRPGPLLVPYRKNGERISPPHSVQVVQIVLGADNYAKLRAGTVDGKRGSAGMVWKIWNERNLNLIERQAADPK